VDLPLADIIPAAEARVNKAVLGVRSWRRCAFALRQKRDG
jgi:hypothetical protein